MNVLELKLILCNQNKDYTIAKYLDFSEFPCHLLFLQVDQLLELEKEKSSAKFELENQLQVARNSVEEKDKEVARLQDQLDKVG